MTAFDFHAIQDIPLGEQVALCANEQLGMDRYVKALREFTLKCGTPMTIAIQGDWGSGKTSMMRLIERDLQQPQHNVQTFWFNTWQFSQFCNDNGTLPLHFLESLVDVIDDREKNGQNSAKGEKLKKLLSPLVAGSARAGLHYLTAGLSSEFMDGIKNTDGNRLSEITPSAQSLSLLKQRLSGLIEDVKQRKQLDRIVVFIDDLDRIEPVRAIELLETLKLFVDIHHCVFILALDFEVVRKGIQKKFGINDKESGRSFFDKIIQLPFQMPVSAYQNYIGDYLKHLLRQAHFAQEQFDDNWFENCKNLLINSVGTNPRSVKRLINVLTLMRISNDLASPDKRLDLTESRHALLLFGFTCMQIAYERLFTALHQNLNQLFVFTDGSASDVLGGYVPESKQEEAQEFLQEITTLIDENSDGTLDADETRAVTLLFEGLQLTSVDEKPDTNVQSVSDRKANIQRHLDRIIPEMPDLLTLQLAGRAPSIRSPQGCSQSTYHVRLCCGLRGLPRSNAKLLIEFEDHTRLYDVPDTRVGFDLRLNSGEGFVAELAARLGTPKHTNQVAEQLELALGNKWDVKTTKDGRDHRVQILSRDSIKLSANSESDQSLLAEITRMDSDFSKLLG